jgi:hypothetical protein
VLEIVVTTSQSDDRSRAVATEKSGLEVDGGLHNRSNPIPNHATLVTGGGEVIPRVLDIKYAKALYTVVQLAMHIYPTVPNSSNLSFALQHFTLFLRRSDHRCHRIRASSNGIATPSQCGITRAV